MTYRDARLHELDLLWMHYFDALKLSGIVRFEDCERVIDAAFKRGQELANQLNKLDAETSIKGCQLEDRIADLERDLDEARERVYDLEQTIRAERAMFKADKRLAATSEYWVAEGGAGSVMFDAQPSVSDIHNSCSDLELPIEVFKITAREETRTLEFVVREDRD